MQKSDVTSQVQLYKKIPGKWILAGEHTVLRGGDALVFPLINQYLELFYFKTDAPFIIELEGVNSTELRNIIDAVFALAFAKLKLTTTQLSGTVRLKSNILFGAGMGASATLCVAVTEFFSHFGYIKDADMYEFARDLENLFHGESSGVDIAVVLTRKPLLFSRAKGPKEIVAPHFPRMFLSHTGKKGITKECVNQVKQLWKDNPTLAGNIDKKMNLAVANFLHLLKEPNEKKWAEVMQSAHSCFYDWGLIDKQVMAHEKTLLAKGAAAVKLTGSGAGGFMLSLWPTDPPKDLPFTMISCTGS